MPFDSYIDTLFGRFKQSRHQSAKSGGMDRRHTLVIGSDSKAGTNSVTVRDNPSNVAKGTSTTSPDDHPGRRQYRDQVDSSGCRPKPKRRNKHTASVCAEVPTDRQQQPSTIDREGSTTNTGPPQSSGHFQNAHHLVLNNPQFIDNMFSAGNTVLERLNPYTMPSAAMDSSARYPPPKCHPGTRARIEKKLEDWVDDRDRQWNMMWLFGSAGTGKSAVAQTFAENCADKRRHGASYFFSRPHKRNKVETVIPTLAYQLAVHCHEYKSILTAQFANDLQLLEKAPHVQLRELIVEPFARLQNDGHLSTQKPFVIILDGLDECEEGEAKREKVQCELVKMISEVVRTKKGLPLVWLICSRPEAHLKHLFSRIPECGREELVIDAETRDDVERYLRAEFAGIKADDCVLADLPSWPSEERLQEILRAVSGLFIFASTIIKYIGNSADANPAKSLDVVVSYLKDAEEIGTTSPLTGLDLLYMRILTDIPNDVFPTTWRILAHFIYQPYLPFTLDLVKLGTTQVLCNFLDIDQYAFYTALRKVYSVVNVPSPEDAATMPLRFYHASFEDFLLDPNRSGKFVITRQQAMADITKSCLFWHNIDTTVFHTDDEWDFDYDHNHDSLPGLKWFSMDSQEVISKQIADFAGYYYPYLFNELPKRHDALLSQVHSFDFRYVRRWWGLCDMASWIRRQDPSSTLVRTEPSSEVDFRLLEYMKVVTSEDRVQPARFPVCWRQVRLKPGYRKYFLMGQGTKSVIIWFMSGHKGEAIWLLNADKEPSEQMIFDFWDELLEIEWPGYDSEASTDGKT